MVKIPGPAVPKRHHACSLSISHLHKHDLFRAQILMNVDRNNKPQLQKCDQVHNPGYSTATEKRPIELELGEIRTKNVRLVQHLTLFYSLHRVRRAMNQVCTSAYTG
jgi:hypothetical protein